MPLPRLSSAAFNGALRMPSAGQGLGKGGQARHKATAGGGGQMGVGEVSLSAFRFTAYWLWGLKGRHDYGLFRFWELGLYKTRP